MTYGQGIAFTGVGPVNRSMGGAGTAAPLDALGALHGNPSSIGALSTNELSFGLELMNPDIRLRSDIGPTVEGRSGWSVIPSMGWVHHIEGSPMTMGLGIYQIGGFKNHVPSNAIFGGDSGYASSEIYQIAPSLSYQVTEHIAVGLAPTATAMTLNFDPIGPSAISPAVTPGQGNPMQWGGGFQTGVFYQGDLGFHAGLTLKSKQWIQEQKMITPTGTIHFDFDYPWIVSAGLAYTGFHNWVFAIDGRYIDYEHTDGFEDFGWKNVLAGAIGIQYQFNPQWSARVGYNFNQSPITSNNIGLNLLDPLIQTQNVSAGATYQFSATVDFNIAYVYLVNNSVTGPLESPPFPAGSRVTHELSAHSIIAGITVHY